MAMTSKKVVVAIAVLGGFWGGVAFYQSPRNSPLGAPIVTPNISGAEIPGHVPALRPETPGPDQLQLSMPFGTAVSQATVEVSLTAPPSGDFELTLTSDQISALVEARYAGLFESLKLPAERLARLRALLVARQEGAIDAANSALMVGVNPIRELPTIQRAIEQVQAPVDAALREEMGELVFSALREFDSTIRERNSAGDFARLLARTGEPLRPDQEMELVHILKNSPGWAPPSDVERAIYGGINDRARISDRAVAGAESVLSPRQLELFRRLQQHWSAEDARRWPNEKRAP